MQGTYTITEYKRVVDLLKTDSTMRDFVLAKETGLTLNQVNNIKAEYRRNLKRIEKKKEKEIEGYFWIKETEEHMRANYSYLYL